MNNFVLEICRWDILAFLFFLAALAVGTAGLILLKRKQKELERQLADMLADQTVRKK